MKTKGKPKGMADLHMAALDKAKGRMETATWPTFGESDLIKKLRTRDEAIVQLSIRLAAYGDPK